MILIILALLSISSKDAKANSFPMIYGCFCEGGIITTTVKSGSEVTINNKKFTYSRMVVLYLHLEESLKKA